MDVLEQFARWLSGTDLSLALQVNLSMIPLIQTVHILALSAVGGAVLMVALRAAGRGTNRPLAEVGRQFFPWIWGGLIVLLISGSFLVIAEPLRSLTNAMFWTKVSLVLLFAITLAVLHRRSFVTEHAPPGEWARAGALLTSVAAGVTVLFVAIVFAGRWIAYTTPWTS